MSRYLGIDLGTSFIKGGVLDLEQAEVRHVRRVPFPGPVRLRPPYVYETDPADVLARTREVLETLAEAAPDATGLVVCSQMHALVLTTETGEACSPCLVWQDQRALMPHPSGQGSYFDVLAAQLSPREVQELGNALRASLPVCALFWSREGGLLPAAATVPASLPDFVVAQLCGVPPTTEPTLAAGHGALDLTSGTWHSSVLRRLGLDGLRWPAVRPTGTLVGTAAIGRARLGCHTPVADHQCALVGALVGRAELSINASTGSQVALLTDELTFGEYEVRPFFDGRHLRTVTRIPAGRALDVLVRLLAEMAEGHGARIDDPWPYVMRLAEAVGETDLHVDLGFFPNACDATGGITNLREDNASVGRVFRAAFQRMADNFHQCAARLAPPSAWDRLVFSGGLLHKSGLLRDLIARRFGAPYRMSPEPEDTLLGLLVLATAFSGRAASVTEAIVAVGAALAARGPAGVAASSPGCRRP